MTNFNYKIRRIVRTKRKSTITFELFELVKVEPIHNVQPTINDITFVFTVKNLKCIRYRYLYKNNIALLKLT